jgi:hypothetical protein
MGILRHVGCAYDQRPIVYAFVVPGMVIFWFLDPGSVALSGADGGPG